MINKDMSKMYELPTECVACGGPLPDLKHRYGKYKDFCSLECRKIGRSYCKACGKALLQNGRVRRNFCDNACEKRFYRVGEAGSSYQEEASRSTCKKCGNPIIQKKRGRRYFCSELCRHRYKYIRRNGIDYLERWGQFAPETRKILLELEDAKMPMTAKRLAAAINREYTPKGRPIEIRDRGGYTSHICKGCGKEFRRYEFSALSRDYCSNTCQLKAGQGIDARDQSGENNTQAKVTWEQVDEIRNLYASERISYETLGEKYGLTKTGIQKIIKGESWKPENDPRRKQAKDPLP